MQFVHNTKRTPADAPAGKSACIQKQRPIICSGRVGDKYVWTTANILLAEQPTDNLSNTEMCVCVAANSSKEKQLEAKNS